MLLREAWAVKAEIGAEFLDKTHRLEAMQLLTVLQE